MAYSRKILIADDHAIFRAGLKQVLLANTDFTEVDEAASGQETLRLICNNDYEALVLDLSMPGRGGFSVLSEARAMKPRLPVLVLSMHPEEQCALRAYKCGAMGYVTKGSPTKEIIEALERVATGKKYVSPSLAEKLVSDLKPCGEGELHEQLSDRECQVLCLIASGMPAGKIADELSLSVKTVSTYRANILRKTCLKNNAEITRYAIENHLV